MSSRGKNDDPGAVPLALDLKDVWKFYPSNPTARSMIRYLSPWPVMPRETDLWALKSITFSLERGKVLGVIGRNGSGKSTLLQIIAGLLKPSRGRVEVYGKIAALIELGAGFNPEFSGRDNVMLSGTIYGYSRAEMEDKFEEIVDFSELHDFIDRPVKTYSSGMYARLAFAVAIQVDPEVLLVDEILAVGDLDFQAKCFRKIESLRERGISILFVSHNLNAVQTLCDRVLLLDHGSMVREGEPKFITDLYLRLLSRSHKEVAAQAAEEAFPEKGYVELVEFELTNSRGEETANPRSGERCRIRYRIRFREAVRRPVFTLQLKTLLGLVVYDQNNLMANQPMPPCRAGDELIITSNLAFNLCPGPYRIGIGIADQREEVCVPLFGDEALAVEVISDRHEVGIASCEADVSYERRPAGGGTE